MLTCYKAKGIQRISNEQYHTQGFILGWNSKVDGACIRRHRYKPDIHPDRNNRTHAAVAAEHIRDNLPYRLDADYPCKCRVCLACHESGTERRRGDDRPQGDSGKTPETRATTCLCRFPFVCRRLPPSGRWSYHPGYLYPFSG